MNISVQSIRDNVLNSKDVKNRTAFIKALILNFQRSSRRKRETKGELYYNGKHAILHDKKRDNKLVVNIVRVLVDQKVGYINLAGVKVEASEIKDEKVDPIKELTIAINKQVTKNERLKFTELHTKSSNKGIEWLHFFINDMGEFDTTIVKSQEVIALENDEGLLEMIIRFFYVDLWTGKEFVKLLSIEIWDNEMSWKFVETHTKKKENSIIVLDSNVGLNPRPHLVFTKGALTFDTYEERILETFKKNKHRNKNRVLGLEDFKIEDANVEIHSWGKVPFSPLQNNLNSDGDLYLFKPLQDDLNKNVSDISNNFDTIQEVVSFTRGMEGILVDNDGNDLDPVAAAKLAAYLIKNAKHLNLPGGGKDESDADFGYKSLELPVEKRYKHIDQLLSMMYTVAMAVSPQQLIDSSVTTGVGITKLFSLLDIKADNNIAYIELMLEEYSSFYTRFFNIKESTEWNKNNIKWKMNKNQVMNTKERVEIAILLSQIISKSSVIKTLPNNIVESVAVELDKLLAEAKPLETQETL